MKFTPKSKEEALSVGLLPKGNYPFVVLKAEEKVSKSNNPMIQVLLKVWDESGHEHLVYDYLMESIEHKLRHFCYAIEEGSMSETGNFDCELVKDKQGSCKIYIQEDKSGQYAPKNAVADYLIPMDNGANLKSAKNDGESDPFGTEDIPF